MVAIISSVYKSNGKLSKIDSKIFKRGGLLYGYDLNYV